MERIFFSLLRIEKNDFKNKSILWQFFTIVGIGILSDVQNHDRFYVFYMLELKTRGKGLKAKFIESKQIIRPDCLLKRRMVVLTMNDTCADDNR